ncbi:thioredoxin family protein [Leptotrichia sp. oral taxon 847]|uniref:thioredoxin family protein n=1 Tax=Leptotrichia sp. oral taxon 847 TaxID=1785996 RepID=UPI0007683E5E|nr:thioredoxin family protein [Leptotrichia sp. oral taxon 847]AMD95067.1 thiol-disulfide isomerase [Leptotrichia sp. oral taxon 847]
MATFEDYLKFGVTEEQEDKKQLRIIEKVQLSEKTKKVIESIDKVIEIVAVAQVYCPDCRAAITFLKKFSDLNDKIKVDYRNRETGAEFFPNLKEGESIKIPSLFVKKGKNYELFWNEFPKAVREEMDKNPDDFENLKYNYRIGKFNEKIEEELVKYFLSL